MIKVGDKFTGIYGRKEVVTSIWLNDKTVGVESGLAYSYEEVYKSWYQQQKQRADELEKQNDILKHNIRVELDSNRHMYIGMCEQKHRANRAEKRWSALKERMEHDEKEAFGEGDVIAHTVHNYVLELMEDLEEDGE